MDNKITDENLNHNQIQTKFSLMKKEVSITNNIIQHPQSLRHLGLSLLPQNSGLLNDHWYFQFRSWSSYRMEAKGKVACLSFTDRSVAIVLFVRRYITDSINGLLMLLAGVVPQDLFSAILRSF